MSHRIRALLSAVALVSVAGCGASVMPQIHDDSSRISVAQRLYDQREYALAAEVLAPYAAGGTGGAAANADAGVYLLGRCHIAQKEWTTAQLDFERLLRDYPESDSAAAAQFRLGESLDGQARGPDFDQEFTLKALQQWMDYRRDHPDHWLAGEATRRIAQCRTRLATKLYRTGDLYVKLKAYEPAKLYFGSVLKEYSETTVYGDAIIGMAIADARLGARDSAIATLRGLEQEFAGRPLGEKAARARAQIQHWRGGVEHVKRRHAPVEAPPQPAIPVGGLP